MLRMRELNSICWCRERSIVDKEIIKVSLFARLIWVGT